MEPVAIVILNYNGQHFLNEFLPGLLTHSKGHRIYVADNSSTDASITFLKNNFPSVELILFDENYGFCEGYNRALKTVKEQHCILVNTDVEVTEDWIEPLLKLMLSDGNIAAVQPKILSYKDKDLFEYAGAAGGYLDKYGFPFCRGRIFEFIEKDQGQYDDQHEIFWATGACLMIKKDLFLNVGGFDSDFFAHMEEIDLCWRFKNKGFKVMYCPSSKVYHVGGGTLAKNNPKKVFLNFRNSLYMLVKNLPSNQLFYKISIRLILDFPAAMMFLWKGSFKNFFMIIWAHMHFYKHLRAMLRKRKNGIPNPAKHAGYLNRSIVTAYFLRKIRKFSEL